MAKAIPWCGMILVVGAMICNLVVYFGNVKTAKAFRRMGDSASAWSDVGLSMSRSLRLEFDHDFAVLAEHFADGLTHALQSQQLMDKILGFAGHHAHLKTREAKQKQTATLLQDIHAEDIHVEPEVSLMALSTSSGNASTLIMHSVDNMLEGLFDSLLHALNKFMDRIEPALRKVIEFEHKFSRVATGALDTFTVSLDFAQKLLDKGMAKLALPKLYEEEMLFNTFNLFDASNTGAVSSADLNEVAGLYGVSALKGQKARQLFEKYDSDNNGQLSRIEFKGLAADHSIPGVLTVVLRTYAKRLAEASGKVAAARQRDEVARNVVHYLHLVCSKNATKVAWLSNALTNGSLPVAFTADVLAELCVLEDSADEQSAVSTGATVVASMVSEGKEGLLAAVELLQDPEFWLQEGLSPPEQASCTARVAEWTLGASPSRDTLLQLHRVLRGDEADALSLAETQALARNVRALAEETRQRISGAMASHLEAKQAEAVAQRDLFDSTLSQAMYMRLGRGVESGVPSTAEQAVQRSQPAAPETLAFAQWLANNASRVAGDFQELCFQYSGESSSPMDTITADFKAFKAKATSFMATLDQFANAGGIDRLRSQVEGFAKTAKDEVLGVVEQEVADMLNNATDVVQELMHNASEAAGNRLGKMLAKSVAGPLAEKIAGQVIKMVSPDGSLGPDVVSGLSDALESRVTQLAGDELGKTLGSTVETILNRTLDTANASGALAGLFSDESGLSDMLTNALTSNLVQLPNLHEHQAGLLALHTALQRQDLERMRRASPPPGSSSWELLANSLNSVVGTVPNAQGLLKYAKEEEAKLSSKLENQFHVLQLKGPFIFDLMGRYWHHAWFAWFLMSSVLLLAVLSYEFWSMGWWGGPEALLPMEDEVVPESATRWEAFRGMTHSWALSWGKKHDTPIFFWSLVLAMTIFLLVVFLVAVTLCGAFGVRALMNTGCAQVLMLNDATLCFDVLSSLKAAFRTFYLGVPPPVPAGSDYNPFDAEIPRGICVDFDLPMCETIKTDMARAMLITLIGGIASFLITFQIVIHSAMAHTRAVERKLKTKNARLSESNARLSESNAKLSESS